MKLTQSELKSLLDYDPETGVLTWKPRPDNPQWTGHYAGKEALTALHGEGYKGGSIHNKGVRAHRVAFCWYHGYWPTEVDHINGDRTDNRIANLREVTKSQNARNTSKRRTDGLPCGVYIRNGRYMAQIKTLGVNHWLGSFDTMEEAAAARKKEEKAHAFHPNHGRSPKSGGMFSEPAAD